MMNMEERVVTLEGRVANLEARVAVAENDINYTKETLKKIDSNTTWLLRIIVGTIITAILGLLITQGGM